MIGGEHTVDATASDGAAEVPRSSPIARGHALGRYMVLGELGVGGMGVVYAAYDPELDRKVAIKLLLAPGDPERARRRLQQEAQAMAKLSHPNVVNVHDVGTVGDRVYVAMEFVAGQTLSQWRAATPRSWRDVVDVFVQIGRGIAAAHAEGLLHRDIKPDNMMIDERGRARVMDFGLALSTDTPTDPTAVRDDDEDEIVVEKRKGTARIDVSHGGKILGTPAYMAPEQFERRPIDARTDQFAFCVSLWEALYGERPFDGEQVLDLIMAITKGQRRSPPKGRGVPARVRRVIERGLSTDPNERWPSMSELLDALVRDPKQRYTRWLGAAAIVAAAIVGLGSWWRSQAQLCTGSSDALRGVWDPPRRATVQEAVLGTGVGIADGVWTRVGPQLDAWADEWTAMHRETCEATRRRGEQSERVMDLRMACLARAKLGLAAAADVLGQATPDILAKAHELVENLPRLHRCADVEALQDSIAPPDASESETVDAIRGALAECEALRHAGAYDDALLAVRRAESLAESIAYEPVRTEIAYELGRVHAALGNDAQAERQLLHVVGEGARLGQWEWVGDAAAQLIFVVGVRQSRYAETTALRELAVGLAAGSAEAKAKLSNHVASALYTKGDYVAAEAEYRIALGHWADARRPDPDEIATVTLNLAAALMQQGRLDEAATQAQDALQRLEASLGVDHPDTANARQTLAAILHAQGKYDTAMVHLRSALAALQHALGAEHRSVAQAHMNLGVLLTDQGEHAEAERQHRLALAIFERTLGADHLSAATARGHVAETLRGQGRHAEAEAEHRAALALLQRTHGTDHPDVARAHNFLGLVLEAQGRSPEAEAEHRTALAIREAKLGSRHVDVAQSRHNLALALQSQGRSVEAEEEHRTALAIQVEVLGADHPWVAQSRHNLAAVLRARGELEEAADEHRRALAIREATFGADHVDVADSLRGLGETLLDLGRGSEALALLQRAQTIVERGSAPPRRRAAITFALARALWTNPAEHARARALAKSAIDLARDVDEPIYQAARDWLAAHP